VRTDRQDEAKSRFSLFIKTRLTNAQCQLYRRNRIKTALLYQRKLRRLGRLVYASLHIQVTMLAVMGTRDGMELAQKHQVLVTHTLFIK